MGFFGDIAKECKRKLSENFRYDPTKPLLERYGPHGYGPRPASEDERPDIAYEHYQEPETNEGSDSYNAPEEYEIEGNTELEEGYAGLYMEKQYEYKQMLIQQMAWQQEKEQQQLWLQGEKERFIYDLSAGGSIWKKR